LFEPFKSSLATSLDPSNPAPLYFQLYHLLVQRIANGEFKPGDSLPSHFKLAQYYGVSYGTVKSAVKMLAAEGLSQHKPGRGTYITSSKLNLDPISRTNVTDAIRQLGGKPEWLVLDKSWLTGPDEAATGLIIPPSKRLYCVALLLLSDKVAIGYHRVYLSAKIAKKHTFENIRDEALLDFLMLAPTNANCTSSRRLEARLAGDDIARLLNVDAAMAIMKIDINHSTADGSFFQAQRSFYRGDRFSYSF